MVVISERCRITLRYTQLKPRQIAEARGRVVDGTTSNDLNRDEHGAPISKSITLRNLQHLLCRGSPQAGGSPARRCLEHWPFCSL